MTALSHNEWRGPKGPFLWLANAEARNSPASDAGNSQALLAVTVRLRRARTAPASDASNFHDRYSEANMSDYSDYEASPHLRRRFLKIVELVDEDRRLSDYEWMRHEIQRCDHYILNLLHKKAIKAIMRTRDPDKWTATEHYCVQAALDMNNKVDR
jgi:hypothetical protein